MKNITSVYEVSIPFQGTMRIQVVASSAEEALDACFEPEGIADFTDCMAAEFELHGYEGFCRSNGEPFTDIVDVDFPWNPSREGATAKKHLENTASLYEELASETE